VFPESSDVFVNSPEQHKLRFRMVEAMNYLLEQHHAGAYSATYVGWPLNYGPRQPGPQDWVAIRRVLDGRRDFVIADGGLKLESRIYTENAAHAILLVVDNPDIAAGKRYTVADENVFSMKHRIQMVAEYMGHEFNFIDMPFELAWPAHPLWRRSPDHQMCQHSLIRAELAYRDPFSAEVAIKRTVDWLLEHRPEPGGEAERQIGDPFDYAGEDELIEQWSRAREAFGPVTSRLQGERTHQYRHPKQPGQTWTDAAAQVISGSPS
jgi:nucleoside-diphosphate-sugar epimerase